MKQKKAEQVLKRNLIMDKKAMKQKENELNKNKVDRRQKLSNQLTPTNVT